MKGLPLLETTNNLGKNEPFWCFGGQMGSSSATFKIE